MRSFEFVTELVGRLESEAPDSLIEELLKALRASLNKQQNDQPSSAAEIIESSDAPIDALIYFEILLDKSDSAEFLFSLGYFQDEALIKKKMLKEGRYRERFARELAKHKTSNLYTYAELIELANRPVIREKFYEAVGKVLG